MKLSITFGSLSDDVHRQRADLTPSA